MCTWAQSSRTAYPPWHCMHSGDSGVPVQRDHIPSRAAFGQSHGWSSCTHLSCTLIFLIDFMTAGQCSEYFTTLTLHYNERTNLPYLNISRQWEVFSQRMTFKPIVSENSAKIWVVCEEHPKHVPDLVTTHNKKKNRITQNFSCSELNTFCKQVATVILDIHLGIFKKHILDSPQFTIADLLNQVG